MATKNDITGDALVSRGANEAYLSNYDKIFRKEKPQEEKEHEQQSTETIEKPE
jgi:predicted negative regulator of RcsB-dependent stress response